MYMDGQQEAFTAKARWRERGLKLATKVGITHTHLHSGPWYFLSQGQRKVAKVGIGRQLYPVQPGDHKPAALVQAFTASLNALETD